MFGRHGRGADESLLRTAGIFYIVQQQRTAAVQLEVEVSAPPAGLQERLDTAVRTHRALILFDYGAHVAIPYPENHVQAGVVIQQLCLNLGPVFRACRMEMIHTKRLGRRPNAFGPITAEGGRPA